MNIEHTNIDGIDIAIVSGDKCVITDASSALDLAMTIKYDTGATNIVIDKAIISEDFFKLSTGIAGEILQKFINYHIKVAVFGEYSQYTSKPLKDFIYESNHGKDFFFVETKQQAITKLTEIKK